MILVTSSCVILSAHEKLSLSVSVDRRLHPALDIVVTLVKSIVSLQERIARVGRVAALYAIKFHLLPTIKERGQGGRRGSRNFSLLAVYFFSIACTRGLTVSS